MANAIYPKFKDAMMKGNNNVSLDANTPTDGVYISLLNSSASWSSSDGFYDAVIAGEVTTPVQITNCVVSNGILTGDDVTFPSVPADTIVSAVLFRKNSGANTTWRLIAWYDSGLGNVPYTSDGSNIPVKFNVSGIFKL